VRAAASAANFVENYGSDDNYLLSKQPKDTPLSRVGSTGAGAGTLAEYILRNG